MKNIAVLGDLILDYFYQVTVDKISPEFPIARMISEGDSPVIQPGGAANVAYQFKYLDVNVDLYGCCNFEQAIIFKKFIKNCDFYISGKYSVPIKKRFYDEEFPLYRWDVEKVHPESDYLVVLQTLLAKIHKKQVEENYYDVLILSDYAKGLFCDNNILQDYLKEFKKLGLKTLVDPKKDIYKWKNVTFIKPNVKEIKENITYGETLHEKIEHLAKTTNSGVITTHAAKGLFIGELKDEFEIIEYKPTKIAKDVNSVVGSGDCYLAWFAYALSQDPNVLDAADLAFKAGQIYIQKKHNTPISLHDVRKWEDSVKAKIVDAEFIKSLNTNVVFTNGCFDYGLTKGHIHCLRFAKQQGDLLVVALNSDASIKRIKGETRPIMNYEERSIIMASLEFVDYVIQFDEDTPYEVIKTIMPDIIVKGGDYKPEDVVGNDLAKVVICPFDYNSLSTTSKLEKISKIT